MSEQDGGEPSAPRNRVTVRPGRGTKRRHRRRKSKYNRPLFSMAHFMVLVFLALGVGFAIALYRAMQLGSSLALQSVDTQRLSDLNLPGVPMEQQNRTPASLQIMIWAYLFGAPILFSLQRAIWWRSTANGAKYLMYSGLALWMVTIIVVLVSAS